MYRAADKSRYPAPVRPGAGECPVLYSDRGARYRWPDLIEICGRHGVSRTMSRKARTPDTRGWRGSLARLSRSSSIQGLVGREGRAVHGKAGRVVGRLSDQTLALLEEPEPVQKGARPGSLTPQDSYRTPVA